MSKTSSKQSIANALGETWKLFWQKWLVLAVFFDTLWFISFTIANIILLARVYDSIDIVTGIVQEKITSLGSEKATRIGMELLNDAQFSYHYHLILRNIGYFFIAAVLLFIVFKGINWLIANRMLSRAKFSDFAKQFVPLTLLWAFAFALIIILMIYLVSQSQFSLSTLLNKYSIGALTIILLICLNYVKDISYSLIPQKKIISLTFKTAVQKFKSILPAEIANISVLFIYFLLWIMLERTNIIIPIAILFLIFITFPLFHFTRLLIIRQVRIAK